MVEEDQIADLVVSPIVVDAAMEDVVVETVEQAIRTSLAATADKRGT